MKWNTATTAQVRDKIRKALAKGCGLSVSHMWLVRILDERRAMAKLATGQPQYFNPMTAMAAEQLRDRILGEDES